MNNHNARFNNLVKTSASAAMTVCATFSRGLSGHSTQPFCRNTRAERPETNVPHPHLEVEGGAYYA